ncbi:MAG: hypothetical protein ABSF43_03990 [Rectinemataceae bacterium]
MEDPAVSVPAVTKARAAVMAPRAGIVPAATAVVPGDRAAVMEADTEGDRAAVTAVQVEAGPAAVTAEGRAADRPSSAPARRPRGNPYPGESLRSISARTRPRRPCS